MGRDNQQKRSEEVKRTIIETALKIIEEEGFEAVSLRKIGDRMGYSIGVIYYYFKDKQEIVDTIHEQKCQEIYVIISKCYKEDAGCLENIKAIFHGIMQIAVTQKEIFDLIVMDKYSVRKEEINPWLNLIEKDLVKGIDKGEIRAIDTYQTAFGIWSSYLGFNYMLGKIKGIDLEKAEEMFTTMSSMILDGLRVI